MPGDKRYSWFGSVRFDIPLIVEPIEFDRNYTEVEATIRNNLPDRKKGFGKSEYGSDIIYILKKFFSNTEAPVCGSIILILLKRYPNEEDISEIVSLIRSHHAIVHVITSATPSGGHESRTMYYVSSKTNGMGVVEYDEHFQDVVGRLPLMSSPWAIYGRNIQVSGSGTAILPKFSPPRSHDYFIEITYQDHVPIKLKNLDLKWDGIELSDRGSFIVNSKNVSRVEFAGNYAAALKDFSDVNYTMSLSYEYVGQDLHNLQIRIYDWMPPSNWPAYSD